MKFVGSCDIQLHSNCRSHCTPIRTLNGSQCVYDVLELYTAVPLLCNSEGEESKLTTSISTTRTKFLLICCLCDYPHRHDRCTNNISAVDCHGDWGGRGTHNLLDQPDPIYCESLEENEEFKSVSTSESN